MATFNCARDGISPLLLFGFLILLAVKETTNSAVPLINVQSNSGQFQPGFLFARLLSELTDTKNEIVQCSNLSRSRSAQQHQQKHQQTFSIANHGKEQTGPQQQRQLVDDSLKNSPVTSKPLSTSTAANNIFDGCESVSSLSDSSSVGSTKLDNAKLANVVRRRCFGKDLISCLQTTRAAIGALNEYVEGLKQELDLTCCKIQRCQQSEILQGKHADTFATCKQMCFQQKLTHGSSSSRETALLAMLSNTSCGDLKYGHFQCAHLNLLALNLLAGPGSAKEWSGAINLLSNCYPTYATDIMWLFQDMMVNMSTGNVKMLHTLLNATLVSQLAERSFNQSDAWTRMTAATHGDVTSQAIQVWHMTPRSVAGIVIVVVLVSASLFLGFYAIYQKVKFHFFPDNTVHYSQVYMQDDFSEEDEEEFDENDVYYR